MNIEINSIWKQRKPKEEFFEFDDILIKLQYINGIKDLNEWLYPTEKSLHNPKLLNNIEKSCALIINAILENKKICVSADVDSER